MENTSAKKAAAPVSFKKKAELYTETALKYLFGLSVKLGQGKEIAKNNYNLGIMHLAKGNYGDAVFRFKVVTWIEPKNVKAWYNLGTAYFADKKPTMAVSSYRRALALAPDDEETAYMLAIARGNRATPEELPKKMPRALALNHFNGLAADYTKDQLEFKQYRGHMLMADVVKSAITPGRLDHVVLDLGCGSGLCALPLRSIATHITGVDMSEAMLQQAVDVKDSSNKKVYDELIKREAHEYLREAAAANYDIVLAGIIFSFVGGLDELIGLIAKTIKPGGMLVFTADMADTQGYIFNTQAGRFGFSKPYLEELARANGFSEAKLQESEVYVGYKMWLGVFKK